MADFSILVPTFNGESFLPIQIESIISQTIQDIEILICDDGSSDATNSIIRDFSRQDARIKVLSSVGNHGQRQRLIQLLNVASAPLIAFSDQDDVWDISKLELLSKGLRSQSMAFGSSHLIDEEGCSLGTTITDRIGSFPSHDDRLGYLFRPYVSAHSALVRREAISIMAFNRFAHFDWLVSLDAAFLHGVTFVPDAITHHRIHGNNQANASFVDPNRWWSKLHPASLYGALQRKRMRRYMFVSALEHLTFSSSLLPAAQKDFGRMGMLCRGAWFDPGISRPFANHKLAKTLIAFLTPYAQSQTDIHVACKEIHELTNT